MTRRGVPVNTPAPWTEADNEDWIKAAYVRRALSGERGRTAREAARRAVRGRSLPRRLAGQWDTYETIAAILAAHPHWRFPL